VIQETAPGALWMSPVVAIFRGGPWDGHTAIVASHPRLRVRTFFKVSAHSIDELPEAVDVVYVKGEKTIFGVEYTAEL
jgi:hypothetical protein